MQILGIVAEVALAVLWSLVDHWTVEANVNPNRAAAALCKEAQLLATANAFASVIYLTYQLCQ
jgi:hypothetical protein